MSGFDFHLDRWTKISTVVLGVLGTIGTYYVTAYVVIPAHERDSRKVCSDYKLDARKALKKSPEEDMSDHVDQITDFCPETRDEARAYVSGEAADAQILDREDRRTKKKISEKTIQTSGFVSLGRADNYQTSNFREIVSLKKAVKIVSDLIPGSVLKARWSVNLRENDKDTELGGNNPILTIPDKACVRLTEKPKLLRGSYWVAVELADCE